MKTILQTIITIAICFVLTLAAQAQFQQIGTTNVFETPTAVNKIGIGNFGANSANVL